MGFKRSSNEATLYVKEDAIDLLIVSVYVDDILVTGSKSDKIEEFKDGMKTSFEISDLGRMSYFLGMEVVQSEQGFLFIKRNMLKNFWSSFVWINASLQAHHLQLDRNYSTKMVHLRLMEVCIEV